MSVLVTDDGFQPDDWTLGFVALDDIETALDRPSIAVDLSPDDDPKRLQPYLDRIDMIRVAFPAFSDGRGFTQARVLRDAGFVGRLRAVGHVLADQYTMARRSGFDEVEIDDELASRQPVAQWTFRSNWQKHDYQSRLRG